MQLNLFKTGSQTDWETKQYSVKESPHSSVCLILPRLDDHKHRFKNYPFLYPTWLIKPSNNKEFRKTSKIHDTQGIIKSKKITDEEGVYIHRTKGVESGLNSGTAYGRYCLMAHVCMLRLVIRRNYNSTEILVNLD